MTLRDFIGTYFYNDIAILPVFFLLGLLCLLILTAAIFFHELGHWFFFKRVKKRNIKIRFVKENWHAFHWEAGTIEDYKDLTPEQYKNMLITGICFGLIPIVLVAYFWFYFLLMVIPYGAGVWKDMKEAGKFMEKEENPKPPESNQ